MALKEELNVRKNIFLMIICILLFVSCNSSRNEGASNTPIVTPEPTVEPVSPPENSIWVEAYADFIMQNNHPPYFIVLDIDFNGVPELFFYDSGYGANMWVSTIVSLSEYGIKQVNVEEQIPAQFELYKDKQTGEMRWMMVMDSFRSSFAHYNYEYKWIDFNDFSDIRTEFFLKWDFEAVTTDSKTNEYEEFYYLFKNESEMVEAEYEEIERYRQELFSRYELIETQSLYASINDFVINKDGEVNSENLDRKLIVEFLLQWK